MDQVQKRDAPLADSAGRRPWGRPTLRVFELKDAEAGVNSDDDGGGFS